MTDRPQVFLDRPPVLYIWRPFYRYVMTPVILPVLSVIRAFFTAPFERRGDALQTQIEELRYEMAQINTRLDALGRQTPAILEKIEATYLDSLGQWSAMEHLITSSLRLADRAAAQRAGVLDRIDSHQGSLAKTVEQCLGQQGVLESQLSSLRTDQQNNWREMEGLILSMLAQPMERSMAVGKQDR